FTQKHEGKQQRDRIEVRWGELRVRKLVFALPDGAKPTNVKVVVGGKPVACRHGIENGRLAIGLSSEVALSAGQALEVEIGL
ncbi:MAG: hypothetical protein JXQ73_21595, partial [Phycisphaerae bacterium]|nr:hypothetical protein [Phycisphaerae bacterium]